MSTSLYHSCRTFLPHRIRTCAVISTSVVSTSKKDSEDNVRDSRNVSKPMQSRRFTGRRFRFRQRVAHSWLKPSEVNVGVPWTSIWQGPKSFDPHVVPFTIRMGRPLKGELPPSALGNLELMKIPNFLHLTPPAIKKHCEALKPLCTAWPEKLPFMPLKIKTRNYVFPSHSVKHPGSKHVFLTFKLSDLNLSEHAREKMIKLAGKRYKEDTDTMVLFAGRCPTRAQNQDYAMYLLKVLYLESNRVEPWEVDESSEGNMTS